MGSGSFITPTLGCVLSERAPPLMRLPQRPAGNPKADEPAHAPSAGGNGGLRAEAVGEVPPVGHAHGAAESVGAACRLGGHAGRQLVSGDVPLDCRGDTGRARRPTRRVTRYLRPTRSRYSIAPTGSLLKSASYP